MERGRTLDAVRKWLPRGAVCHQGCPFRRLSRGPSAFVPRTAKGNPGLAAAVVRRCLRALRRTVYVYAGTSCRGLASARSWRCDPQDKERTQAEANPETKGCYQEVLSCLFTR